MTIKHPDSIKLDLDQANSMKGPERLAATRRLYQEAQAYERYLAQDQNAGRWQDVVALREVTALLQSSLSRLEAAEKRRIAREATA